MTSDRLLDPETFAYEARHVKLEVDRLVAVAERQLQRLEQAAGKPNEHAIRYDVENQLASIKLQLSRSQLGLVHRSDARHAAAQALLRATDGSAHRTPVPLPAAEAVAA